MGPLLKLKPKQLKNPLDQNIKRSKDIIIYFRFEPI